MLSATRGGDGWLWYTVGGLVLLFGGASGVRAAASAGSAAAAGTASFVLLKRLFKRERPCAIAEHCWADLLPPDQFSFPSGHSITAFSVAVALGSFYPVLMPPLLFCAFSVALSRVALGMHFLSDVIAGGAIGTALGYLAAGLFR